MSLADDLYKANNSVPTDELGIPLPQVVDYQYLVKRALIIATRDRSDQFTIHQPHVADEIIYLGNQPLFETLKNFYFLTEYEGKVSPATQAKFWKLLKQCLPRLDTNIIQISPNLFWSKIDGAILTLEDIYERYPETNPEKDQNQGTETDEV